MTVELDVEVAAMLRAHPRSTSSGGEIVERALRAADLRALIARIRARSDLDEDAATRVVDDEPGRSMRPLDGRTELVGRPALLAEVPPFWGAPGFGATCRSTKEVRG